MYCTHSSLTAGSRPKALDRRRRPTCLSGRWRAGLLFALAAPIAVAARAETFDLLIHRYCDPAQPLCEYNLASEAELQRRLCESVQEMNVIWEPTGISFRPTVLPGDGTAPAGGLPGAPPDKDRYYETAGCAPELEDKLLRLHWAANVAAAHPEAVSWMVTPRQNGCCSGITGTNSPPTSRFGVVCDAARPVLETGSIWAHEMGHRWGLHHTQGKAVDPADGNTADPVNNPDSVATVLCTERPLDPLSGRQCTLGPAGDADCAARSGNPAATCAKDALKPVVHDTPADPKAFEEKKKACEGETAKACANDTQCGPGGSCVWVGGRDEDAAGLLIEDHEWIADPLPGQRKITPVAGATDRHSPHSTYCDTRVKRYARPAPDALPYLSDADAAAARILVRNVMSYHSERCRGPVVLEGQSERLEAFTPDQLGRVASTRATIPEYQALPDVCLQRGGDTDHDGICDLDDGCPYDKNTCQSDRDGDGIADACDLCPDHPGATADLDLDGIGDVCDTDVDGDGCSNRLDSHPRDSMIATGILSSYCNGVLSTGVTRQFEGIDSDGDGVANCADPDDDNDGTCDGEHGAAPAIPGAEDGCSPGPDECPTDTADQCHYHVQDPKCPAVWSTCTGLGCDDFLVKISLVQPVGPSRTPAPELVFDRFQILDERIYLEPLPGRTLLQTAVAVRDLAAPQPAGSGRTAPARVRMTIWPRTGERPVAVVGEYAAAALRLGRLDGASLLLVEPSTGRDGGPVLEIDTVDALGAEATDRLVDGDGDGLADVVDNCTARINPDQRDADEDGFGDRCDPDLDNDGAVTDADVEKVRSCQGADLTLSFGIEEPALADDGAPLGGIDHDEPDRAALELAAACVAADFDGDSVVGSRDLDLAAGALGGAPGPSSLGRVRP